VNKGCVELLEGTRDHLPRIPSTSGGQENTNKNYQGFLEGKRTPIKMSALQVTSTEKTMISTNFVVQIIQKKTSLMGTNYVVQNAEPYYCKNRSYHFILVGLLMYIMVNLCIQTLV
jgi:hypothetical protein